MDRCPTKRILNLYNKEVDKKMEAYEGLLTTKPAHKRALMNTNQCSIRLTKPPQHQKTLYKFPVELVLVYTISIEINSIQIKLNNIFKIWNF